MSLRRIEEKQAVDKEAWERDVLTRRTKDSCGIKLPPKKHVASAAMERGVRGRQ